MMPSYYITADALWSPIGDTTVDAVSNIIDGKISLKKYTHKNIGAYVASKFDASQVTLKDSSNLFEYGIFKIIDRLIEQTGLDLTKDSTYVVLASTKGNIESILSNTTSNIPLIDITHSIQKKYKSKHTPVVVSNACVSGIQAFAAAQYLLSAHTNAKDILIIAGDLVSDFVLSGFHSFQALSNEPCKPFDKDRNGLNLGDGFAGVVLSKEKNNSSFKLLGTGSSNDANHISGPSRTGDGLTLAIKRAIEQSNLTTNQIDVICAHGTATPYNDEMESLALQSLALTDKNIYGLKGYFGHTLGGAGLIESIVSMHLLKKQLVIKSIGYNNQGTSVPLNISTTNKTSSQKYLLKTGAGFGGGNAALIIELN